MKVILLLSFAFFGFVQIGKSNETVRLSYFYDQESKHDLETVKNQTFILFESRINEGLQNGSYWIKVECLKNNQLIEFPSVRFGGLKAYHEENEVKKIDYAVFPTYQTSKGTSFYKIICDKEGHIPISIHTPTEYVNYLKRYLIIIGMYYGFALMTMIVNLYFYYNFREKTFLYYTFFLFTISTSLAIRDNFWGVVLGTNTFMDIEFLPHIGVGLTGAFFAHTFLQHDLYLPKFKYFSLPLAVIVTVALFLSFILQSHVLFIVGEYLGIFLLAIYWGSGLYLFFKNNTAKVFTVAYFIILIFAFDFYMSPLLGLDNFGITINMLKIGGVFEMLVLSFAVVVRMKILQKENNDMRTKIFDFTSQLQSLSSELEKSRTNKNNSIILEQLNPRETEVLTLISEGKINKEMAEEMGLSINTIKFHTKNLYSKLNINTRQEARLKASEL